MNFEASSEDSNESLIAIGITKISISCCLLTSNAHNDGNFVLDAVVSTITGMAYSVHVLEDYNFITGIQGVSVFDVNYASRTLQHWLGVHSSSFICGRNNP